MNQADAGYFWETKSWYWKVRDGIVTFGLYPEEGGTDGEMSMRWEPTGPHLMVFSDAFHLLTMDPFVRVWKYIEKRLPLTEEEFVGILGACGFRDLTQYDSPYEDIVTKKIEEYHTAMAQAMEAYDYLAGVGLDPARRGIR